MTAGAASSELVTPGGKTRIADGVVAKIASMAAGQVGGVHAMGTPGTLGAVKDRLPGVGGAGGNRGVSVQVGERQTAVDIDLVVDYGVSIPELAGAVRTNVIGEVEHMCGLEVVEVNITVDDIHVPGEDDGDRGDRGSNGESRVQ
ncbi:Asp23/Gls24 family envelope stress response protein [Actinomadura rubrisoli]|uniref:Asp23/Gls24 family envelope stress response protein n=1 Tax=Actinomadura rubrisoli TaxID=2530368 RepID=A0A4R4ZNG7_9ACTN|nr:Asp23/Gls24 family envelope stress response protein [Actinomadura rubrisoli]TDD59289.1 Asp23/Gls24 family envelope stress response protein [Actinomadura rubrisoli]